MDPSIMKLLEEDEDESLHSGADVEAFTAALNRDIEGGAPSSPPPSNPNTSGLLSQENTLASQQLVGQCQTSSQEENIFQQTKQQEEREFLLSSEQHPFHVGLRQQGSVTEDTDQQFSSHPEHEQMQEHSLTGQKQNWSEGHSLNFIERDQDRVSEQISVHFPNQENIQHSEDEQQHQLQDIKSQQVPHSTVNQANNAIRHTTVAPSATIPILMLFPMLLPHLDKDRRMQLQAVYAKLRHNEVSKEDFLRVSRNIVGQKLLRRAAYHVQMQVHAQAARNQQINANQYSLHAQPSSQQFSTCGDQQCSESQAFPPLRPLPSSQKEKGHRSPTHQTCPARTETSFTNLGSTSQTPREIENKSDGKGLQAAQISSTNLNTINPERENTTNSFQAISKQQQHTQLPPASCSMYESSVSNLHPHVYPRQCISGAATSLKPQTRDSQARQNLLNQGMVSTQLGAPLPMNTMSVPMPEQKNSGNETKKSHSGTLTHLTSRCSVQQNPIAWQPSANKEQRSNAFPLMAHVKQEVADQSQFTALEGSSFSSLNVDQGSSTVKCLKDDNIGKHPSRMAFSNSTGTATTNKISGPVPMQVDQTMQSRPQISTATPLVAGTSVKTPSKKPSLGQKKSFEALGTSSPPASKKQRTAGAFIDQSIEQLNDVTAVSGVNLREEEEQLLSGPKEESRATEATRRVVQEEEERLILQKGPLQRKLRDIMLNCGITSMSSDVDRCLSMCVEERLRGLMSNLIRLSKQRVGIEKTRHRFVITSDVRRQILAVNQKAKEDWEKKQAEEAERLRKLNQIIEGDTGAEGDREKEESRSKSGKINKEEDDKMRTTAANVAARAAVGGDDMLSKWQLMAEQARQKREGLDGASSSQPSKSSSHKALPNLRKTLREHQEFGKNGSSAASISGGMRKFGRGSVAESYPKIARSISMKDVIAVLEREPQMSKSTLIHCLYERARADSAVN